MPPEYVLIITPEVATEDAPAEAEFFMGDKDELSALFDEHLQGELIGNAILARVIRKAEVTYRVENSEDYDGQT
jgi:hypothetical protein